MDVSPVMEAYLSANKGPAADDPAARVRLDYGIVATLTGGLLEVRLTFRRGAAYCCFEPGCHLGLFAGRRWNPLRRHFASAGFAAPGRLELRLTGVVEAGALTFGGRRLTQSRPGVYELEPSAAYDYQTTEEELPAG